MSRSNEAAFPFPSFQGPNAVEWGSPGLSVREHFAGLAMQGLAAIYPQGGEFFDQHIATGAVRIADALIAELAKPAAPKADVGDSIESYLTERIDWLNREIDGGGDRAYLSDKRVEVDYILQNVRAIRALVRP